MDLPLWEHSDDQSHVMPFDESCHDRDSWLFDHSSGDIGRSFYFRNNLFFDLYFERDVIEEDALNEKYCVQVLRIMMGKADEEIMKLEEDIVMLQCQLAWDDEDWSKLCSAALREKIDQFDVLIQSLKKETRENAHCFSVEKLPPRLPDLVKPLLESYCSAKNQQTKSDVPDAGVSENSLGPKTLKQDDRKSLVVVPDNKKMKNHQHENDATSGKCISDACKCAYDNLLENDFNKLNKLQEKKMLNLAPAKSGWGSFNKLEPKKNSIMIERSACVSTGCTPQRESRSTKLCSESQKTAEPSDLILDIQSKCTKQISEASRNAQMARTNRRIINNNVVFTNPSLTTKRKRTRLSEQTLGSAEMKDSNSGSLVASFSSVTKLKGNPKVKVEPTTEPLTQMPHIPNLLYNRMFLANEADTGSSSTKTSKRLKNYGGYIKTEDTITTNSSSQKRRSLSMKKDIQNFLAKLEKSDDEIPIFSLEEATINHGVKDLSWISPLCIKDVDKLSLNDLKAIAKNQKIPGYYKLRKAELQKRLGLHL